MERAAGAPLLSLRLLPRQLLNPGTRRAGPRPRRNAAGADRAADDRSLLPLPYPAADHERPSDLYRTVPVRGPAGGSADLGMAGYVSAVGDEGLDPNHPGAWSRWPPASAGEIRAHS